MMTSPIPRFCLILLALVAVSPLNAAEADFPVPPGLERDVAFWKRVFTDVSDDEGVLHDNRNLAIVYEVMPMPAATGRRERNRRVAARRKYYRQILQTLASGKRSGLSDEESRVLALWPDDVSNDELQAATGRIRFQHGLSDRFAEGLSRSGRWRAHVNEVFTRHGVPIELAALPHVESSYNPAARSHVGASGIWQFTRSTGRRFMRVDHVLDERNDPFLATEAAAKLLAYNYSIAGNWPMAITAYNHGLAGVRRAMRRHGDTAYTDILRRYNGRAFGFASRNFYVAFLAAKEVDQNPERYFPGVTPEPAEQFALFSLDSYMPADELVDALGISEREFRRYNPALQPTIWQGSKHVPRDFELRVPRSRLSSSIDDLLASTSGHDEQLPDLYHTISRGDTLSKIAGEYNTNVSTLVALNGLRSRHRIRAGQRLRLPAAGPAPEVVAAAQEQPEQQPAEPAAPEVAVAVAANLPAIEELPADVSESEPAPAEPPSEGLLGESLVDRATASLQSALLTDPSDYTVADDRTIEVHPLETLGHYADWLGIRTQRLRDINGLKFRTPVRVGRRIKLDLDQSTVADFERRRAEYHREQQDAFFRTHTISGVKEHTVANGESLWILSLRRYDVPVWLFRQYNPEVDMHRVSIGTKVRFPLLEGNTS